jgi:hypothetical protein
MPMQVQSKRFAVVLVAPIDGIGNDDPFLRSLLADIRTACMLEIVKRVLLVGSDYLRYIIAHLGVGFWRKHNGIAVIKRTFGVERRTMNDLFHFVE